MCKRGTLKELLISDKIIFIDSCLWDMVRILNNAGFKTESCCCGHGGRPGHIRFTDGTEFMIMKDFKMARKVETLMGNMHGNSKKANNAKKRKDQ